MVTQGSRGDSFTRAALVVPDHKRKKQSLFCLFFPEKAHTVHNRTTTALGRAKVRRRHCSDVLLIFHLVIGGEPQILEFFIPTDLSVQQYLSLNSHFSYSDRFNDSTLMPTLVLCRSILPLRSSSVPRALRNLRVNLQKKKTVSQPRIHVCPFGSYTPKPTPFHPPLTKLDVVSTTTPLPVPFQSVGFLRRVAGAAFQHPHGARAGEAVDEAGRGQGEQERRLSKTCKCISRHPKLNPAHQ